MPDLPGKSSAPDDLEGQPQPRRRMTVSQDDLQAPLTTVRHDVDRFADLFRSIHSRYLWVGLLSFGATALAGTIIGVAGGLPDWFMHAGMYLVIGAFLLFYVRAHLEHRKIARALYAVATLAILGFFVWVLIDLVGGRLEVVDADVTGQDGTVIPGPNAVLRGALGALWVPAIMLSLTIVWLLFHWLFVARFRHNDIAADLVDEAGATTS